MVVLSTVRSQVDKELDEEASPDIGWLKANLGFIMNPHQINVGITRSKHGLIIIGELVHHVQDRANHLTMMQLLVANPLHRSCNPIKIMQQLLISTTFFILLGNSKLLCFDSNNWKSLIGHYKKKGCIVNCQRFVGELERST